jgi:hypothetical protein
MAFTSRSSLSSLSTLFTSAAVLTALAFSPGCSSGDVPIGQDGTSTRNGTGGISTDGGSGGVDAGQPATCTTDSDCTGGDHCGFLVADACSATGQCLAPELEPNCGALIANCACDGTTVYTGCTDLPTGYASKPVAEANAGCQNAADGGGGGDAGEPTSCTTSADCTNEEICGFQESQGCSAKGSCFPVTGAGCQSVELVCACSGTTPVNAVCNNLPSGYATAPVVYPLDQSCK